MAFIVVCYVFAFLLGALVCDREDGEGWLHWLGGVAKAAAAFTGICVLLGALALGLDVIFGG